MILMSIGFQHMHAILWKYNYVHGNNNVHVHMHVFLTILISIKMICNYERACNASTHNVHYDNNNYIKTKHLKTIINNIIIYRSRPGYLYM